MEDALHICDQLRLEFHETIEETIEETIDETVDAQGC
jgi:hypothetical protein